MGTLITPPGLHDRSSFNTSGYGIVLLPEKLGRGKAQGLLQCEDMLEARTLQGCGYVRKPWFVNHYFCRCRTR